MGRWTKLVIVMRRALRHIRNRNNARWLIAAAFLFVMFVGIGSGVVDDLRDRSGGRALTWCDVMHHHAASADCPHKRQPFNPQSAYSNDVIHSWVLVADLAMPVSGSLYTLESTFFHDASPIERSLDPPFQPPKQA